MCFRHELKYMIGYPQYLELTSRLKPVMQKDDHTGTDGRYLITTAVLLITAGFRMM